MSILLFYQTQSRLAMYSHSMLGLIVKKISSFRFYVRFLGVCCLRTQSSFPLQISSLFQIYVMESKHNAIKTYFWKIQNRHGEQMAITFHPVPFPTKSVWKHTYQLRLITLEFGNFLILKIFVEDLKACFTTKADSAPVEVLDCKPARKIPYSNFF